MPVDLRAAFVERFVLPLVGGGEVHVGAPLGAAGLARLLDAPRGSRSPAERQLERQRAAVAATLQANPVRPRLDEDALRLAVALHDLLFLRHPGAGSWASPAKTARRVAEGAAAIARLAPTGDADVLVARHTVLHLLPVLRRNDSRITFWAGQREFRGQTPPPRLLAWPRLRRVREERWTVGCLAEAAGDVGAGAVVVRALLAASPLTDLLDPLRAEPRLDLSRLAAVLVAPEVCRMVAYRYLEEGLETTGGALAQAVVALLGAREVSSVPIALALLCHLHLCLLAAGGDARSEAARLAARGAPAQRDFCGLFAAVRRVAPSLAAPADARDDPRLADHAAACAAACGAARTRELIGLVARALGVSELAA